MADDAPKLDPKVHPYVFSASQIETAQMCLRKWAFDKIDRIPREDTDATRLGTEVHEHLERYLKYATVIDTSKFSGKIAMSGIQHLPPPKSLGLRVEEWFVRKYGQITFWGKKDYSFMDYARCIPVVGDHKTCGAFTWAKSEFDLQTTVQSGIYGWDAMEEEGTNIAELRWVYFRTKGGRASLPVFTQISRMQAEAVMESVMGTSELLVEMLQTFSKGQAIEAPPNYSACEAFGGCPHKDKCKPTAKAALVAIMTQKTNESLLADLKNRKMKKAAGTPPAEAPAVVAAKVEVDKKATEDVVNPPDRDAPPPPPPSPLQVGGKWYQPSWDETEYAWKFGEDYHAAVQAEAEAKRAAEKASKKQQAKKAAEKSDGMEAAPVAAPAAGGDADLLALLVERIAVRVADIMEERSK
jgi:hypothetical protein